jgi:DNA-binding beta-propeller fold protein YncE
MGSEGGGRTKARAVFAVAMVLGLLSIPTPALAAVGDLTPKGSLSLVELSGANSVAVSPDGTSVYVTAGNKDLIYHFKRDPASGRLRARGCVEDNDTGPGACAQSADGLDVPTSVAVSPDGRSVYVTSQGDSAITRFSRNLTTGKLSPRDCIDSVSLGDDTCGREIDLINNPGSVAVSSDNKSVYVMAGGTDTVLVFNRNTTSGRLTYKQCWSDPTGGVGCPNETTGLFGGDFVTVSPDGKSVYAVSDSTDTIVRFDRDTTGKLTAAGCVEDGDHSSPACDQTADGLDGASSAAVSPDNKSVYVVSLGDDAIVRFDRDTTTGAITPAGCVDDNDTGPEPCDQSTDALNGPISVAVSPDAGGRSVYVVSTVFGGRGIVHLDRDPATGALTPVGCISDDFSGDPACAQTTDLFVPNSVAVSPDANSVYVTDGTAIARFKRETAP